MKPKKKPTSTLKLIDSTKMPFLSTYLTHPLQESRCSALSGHTRAGFASKEEGSEGGWLKRALVDMDAEGCLSISR